MRRSLLRLASVAASLLLSSQASAVAIDWVTVDDPGNARDTDVMVTDDTTGYGSVSYTYRISKFETTNAQYAEFLNAVDPTGANALELYNPMMGSSLHGGIDLVALNPISSRYELKSGMASKPVNLVSFYDAIRFANWMHNGQGNGSTEAGAYTLLGGEAIPSNGLTVTRNPGATIVLAGEDEWYKAAYYDPDLDSYFNFPAGMDFIACAAPSATPNTANCESAVGTVTEVGVYTGALSPFGTFDQAGNVWEVIEDTVIGTTGETNRVVRGGYWASPNGFRLSASYRGINARPTREDINVGFRVASVPEPSTALLLAFGFLLLPRRISRLR